jgi:hypothetical protein
MRPSAGHGPTPSEPLALAVGLMINGVSNGPTANAEDHWS